MSDLVSDVGEDTGGSPVEEFISPAERVDGPDIDTVSRSSKGLDPLPGQAGFLGMDVIGPHDLQCAPPVI